MLFCNVSSEAIIMGRLPLSVLLLGFVLTLSSCFWMAQPYEEVVVFGEFPVLLEQSGETIWLLTESVGEDNKFLRKMKLYRSPATAVSFLATASLDITVEADDMWYTPTIAGFAFETTGSVPVLWIFDSRYAGRLARGNFQTKKVDIIDVEGLGGFFVMPFLNVGLRIVQAAKDTWWISVAESRRYPWPLEPNDLPLIVFNGKSARVVLDRVVYAGCTATECRIIRMLNGLAVTYAEAPDETQGGQPETAAQIPEHRYDDGLLLACTHEDATLVYAGGVTYSHTPAGPGGGRQVAPGVSQNLIEESYLFCPPGRLEGPFLSQNLQRRFSLIPSLSEAPVPLELRLVEPPMLTAGAEWWPSGREEGFATRAIGWGVAGWLVAAADLVEDHSPERCVSENGWGTCHRREFATRLLALDTAGKVSLNRLLGE
jgi:hypothetical protein